MPRAIIVALFIACTSVLVSLIRSNRVEVSVGHAIALLLPLAMIGFPKAIEAIDAGVRRTFQGMAHGGEGPTPAILFQVVGWGLLMVLIGVHHLFAFTGAGG